MGYEGLAALRDFVERGGTFVTLGSATNLPIDFGMVRGIGTSTPRDLFVPGSIVSGRVEQPRHPIAYGFDSDVPLFHQFGPYLSVPNAQRGNVILRYAPAGEVFLSGYVSHPAQLGGQPAAVSVPVGEGHVVMFGFNPLHRFQTHGNFAMVWNVLANWDQLDVGLGTSDDEEAADGATLH